MKENTNSETPTAQLLTKTPEHVESNEEGAVEEPEI